MNKRQKFFVYTGMVRYIRSECRGMFCYEFYRYRKWHPLLWVMVLLGLLSQMIVGLMESIQELRKELNDEVDIIVTNNLKDGRRRKTQ